MIPGQPFPLSAPVEGRIAWPTRRASAGSSSPAPQLTTAVQSCGPLICAPSPYARIHKQIGVWSISVLSTVTYCKRLLRIWYVYMEQVQQVVQTCSYTPYTYIHPWQRCTHARMHYTRTHTHTHTHACIHTHTHARTYARTHMHTRTNARTHGHTHTYMHTHTHTHMHTRTHTRKHARKHAHTLGIRYSSRQALPYSACLTLPSPWQPPP